MDLISLLAFQVALLKRHSSLLILFDPRNVGQAGRYPDLVDGDHEGYDRQESIPLLALPLAQSLSGSPDQHTATMCAFPFHRKPRRPSLTSPPPVCA